MLDAKHTLNQFATHRDYGPFAARVSRRLPALNSPRFNIAYPRGELSHLQPDTT